MEENNKYFIDNTSVNINTVLQIEYTNPLYHDDA